MCEIEVVVVWVAQNGQLNVQEGRSLRQQTLDHLHGGRSFCRSSGGDSSAWRGEETRKRGKVRSLEPLPEHVT